MATIMNISRRGYGLPKRTHGSEEQPVKILYGLDKNGNTEKNRPNVLEIPDWYLAELRKEPTVAKLFGKQLIVTVEGSSMTEKRSKAA
jgi:hypothetical protein